MKIRILVLAAVVAFLLLGAVALRHPSALLSAEVEDVALAQSGSGSGPPLLYTVEQGTASGGDYHLTSLAWRVSGTASGAGYRLLGPAAPTLRGNGCCCSYLPCVLHNHQ